ncbi:MAG: right-handed parallel beta-helix repeat-containing protein [Kiritimatiellae bacterium]|nr:right-handed parallel beta-helix repeat-containing protein [Kiritimatiellia bacterium]
MNVKSRKMIAAIAITFAAGILMSRADTHYVSLDGTNNSPYLNWPDAATQIQWAVDAADAATFDTVLVSNGTYNLTNQINLTNNVTVKSLNGTNLTFINGNYPAYTNRCVFMSGGSVLDGFTISNGFLPNKLTNGPAGYPFVGLSVMYRYDLGGAGIGIRGVATVKNCYIYKNFITNSGGGGIYVHVAYNVTISNCTVVGNTCDSGSSGYGGGIFWGGCTPNPGLLIDSYISGNTGGYNGGFFSADESCLITNCTIAGNSAIISEGGGRLQNVPGVGMANCVISNNTCVGIGSIGGLHVYGSTVINSIIIANRGDGLGGVAVDSGGMLSNCQVIANTTRAYYGGGIRLSGSATKSNVVANCIIANNVSTSSAGMAGIWIENGGLVKNCLIYCNTNNGSIGGVRLVNNALYTNYPYGLINCTIVDNVSLLNGSGIYALGTSNYIENCIVVSNVTSAGAQANAAFFEQ